MLFVCFSLADHVVKLNVGMLLHRPLIVCIYMRSVTSSLQTEQLSFFSIVYQKKNSNKHVFRMMYLKKSIIQSI